MLSQLCVLYIRVHRLISFGPNSSTIVKKTRQFFRKKKEKIIKQLKRSKTYIAKYKCIICVKSFACENIKYIGNESREVAAITASR